MIKDMPTFQPFELPKYEVFTPHTKQQILMRSLLVQQEEALKASSTSPGKTLEIINKIVFDCMENKPSDPEIFLNNFSMGDREALIFGLIIASYGEMQEFQITCGTCSQQFSHKANLTENVEIKPYDGKENLLKKEIHVELPVSKAIAILHMPSLMDEFNFSRSKGIAPDVIRKAEEYLVVKELQMLSAPEKKEEEKKEPKRLSVNNIFEIYAYMRNMSARDRRTIYTSWQENFGEYGLRVKVNTTCPFCSSRNELPISMVGELFRLS